MNWHQDIADFWRRFVARQHGGNMFRKIAAALGAAALILGLTATPATASGPGYYYAGATQSGVGSAAKGMSGKIYIANPYRQANSGEHIAMELTGHDTNASNNNTVGLGWIKNGSGTGGPRLFLDWWKNGVSQTSCWFGCATWVDNGSNPIDLGADLTTVASGCNGTTTLGCVKQFIFQYFSGVSCGGSTNSVWFYYDTVAIGCLPDTAVPGTTTFDEYKAFGEVYYGGATVPCTDMDTFGRYATATASASGSAFISSIGYTGTGAPTPSLTLVTGIPQYDAGAYTVGSVGSPGNRTFTLGGPGRTSTGATPGNAGSC